MAYLDSITPDLFNGTQMPAVSPQMYDQQFGGQQPNAYPPNTNMPTVTLADIAKQYQQNQQQPQNDLANQILSARFQPTQGDVAQAGINTAMSFAPDSKFAPTTPEQIAQQRIQSQFAPYTALADMQAKQGQINLQNAQASSLNNALTNNLAEKQFEYQNSPQMMQQRLMNQYLQQMSAPNAAQPGSGQPGQQPNGQPAFNPMGAMIAKQFGLDNMQIGPNGQPQMIPGTVTPGQKEQDTNFAQSYQTYANEGGASRTQNALSVIDHTIDALKQNKLTTGDLSSRMSLDSEGKPSLIAQLGGSPVLVARNMIASAILPQAKALFGSRVTNFDAQSLINSQGIDPLADNATNIQKLTNLRNAVASGQQDLETSGQYFQQHGTLAGYQPNAGNSTPNTSSGKTINFSDLPQ